MLSHINDSPMGALRCFRYPKEIQFANIKEDVSRDAILFKRQGNTTNTVKIYLSLVRNYAYLWLAGFPKDANLSHSFSDINKMEIPASQMRKVWVFFFYFQVNVSTYDIDK